MSVEGLTVDDVAAIFEYWAEFPPTNEMVAYYLGLSKPKGKKATVRGLAAALGGR